MALGLDGRFLYRDIYLSNVFGTETPLSGQAIKELYESTVQDYQQEAVFFKQNMTKCIKYCELFIIKA